MPGLGAPGAVVGSAARSQAHSLAVRFITSSFGRPAWASGPRVVAEELQQLRATAHLGITHPDRVHQAQLTPHRLGHAPAAH
jgi:hypothetical protein